MTIVQKNGEFDFYFLLSFAIKLFLTGVPERTHLYSPTGVGQYNRVAEG